MNPLYDIINQNYIQQQAHQQDSEDIPPNVTEALSKLTDFLNAADKVSPEHRNMFCGLCCGILLDYKNKHFTR